MATAFAERELETRDVDVELVTGGTDPAERVHRPVVESMAECGFDVEGRTPREVTLEELQACDYVITMDCSAKDVCPASWAGENRDWDLDDPDENDAAAVRGIRDEIRERVGSLFDEIEGGSRDGPERRN